MIRKDIRFLQGKFQNPPKHMRPSFPQKTPIPLPQESLEVNDMGPSGHGSRGSHVLGGA